MRNLKSLGLALVAGVAALGGGCVVTGGDDKEVQSGDVAVAITSLSDGAVLGRAAGTPGSGSLTVTLNGTVQEGASVSVRANAGDPVPATVVGTNWTTAITLPEGVVTLTALATAGSLTGQDQIGVTVDVTPPSAPSDLAVAAIRRNAVRATFTAPTDATGVTSCQVKRSTSSITEANWDAADAVSTLNSPSGAMSVDITLLRTGIAWSVGVTCQDGAGNVSALATAQLASPLSFTVSDVLTPAAQPGYYIGDAWFGYHVASGNLDGDAYDDLIVSAPAANLGTGDCESGYLCEGLVYVYRGSAQGIGSTPDFVLRGTDATNGASFGQGLAVLDWNGDGVDDLAIGAPWHGGGGEIFLFYGGPTFASADDVDANVRLKPAYSDPNDASFFSDLGDGAAFGYSLDAIDFDGDGNDDLAIGLPGAEDYTGGAIVLFGRGNAFSCTTPCSVGIPDGLASAGLKAYKLTYTGESMYAQFGDRVGSLGRVTGVSAEHFFVGSFLDEGAQNAVYVYYGRAQPTSAWETLTQTAAEEKIVPAAEADAVWFAQDMGSIEDQNGDGNRELVLNAWAYGPDSGRVYFLAGGAWSGGQQLVRDLSQANTALLTIDGASSGSRFGLGLALPGPKGGDVDGDGHDDLLVAGTTQLMVFFGASMTMTSETQMQDGYTKPTAFVRPTLAAWVGDLNGDGLADVVWSDSMWHRSSSLPQPGAVQVLY